MASEQALAWSGLPIVTLRPMVFLEGSFVPLTAPTVRDRDGIELPFGRERFNSRLVAPIFWQQALSRKSAAATRVFLAEPNDLEALAQRVLTATGWPSLSLSARPPREPAIPEHPDP